MGQQRYTTKPYVVVDVNRNVGIFLLRGHKFVSVLRRDPHFAIRRLSFHDFDTEWQPLFYYTNGAPSGVPYDLQSAARRFLEYGRNAGITEGALRCLNNIIDGELSMSGVEAQQSKESETIIPPSSNSGEGIPKMENLADALGKANGKTKKASTKNGTTAAAKRPSKAAVSKGASDSGIEPAPTSTQEKEMKATQAGKSARKVNPAVVAKSVKNGKIAGEKKPKEKKKAPAAKTVKQAPPKGKTKKAAAKKTAATGTGRVPKFSDDAIIMFVADNPKRAGTDAFRKYAQYKKGMRLGDVIKKNVDRADVNYNIARGFVKVKG
jgi:hypothetical protein